MGQAIPTGKFSANQKVEADAQQTATKLLLKTQKRKNKGERGGGGVINPKVVIF